MTDGLAASVFGSTAHPPRSHSCEEGLSRREHGEKEVTSVPTSRPARLSHGKSSPRWGWFGTWRGRGRGLGLLSSHSPAREFGAQLQAPSKIQIQTLGFGRSEAAGLSCALCFVRGRACAREHPKYGPPPSSAMGAPALPKAVC